MSTVAAAESIQRDLAAIVGEQNVQHGETGQLAAFAGFVINGVAPANVVSPGSVEEVAAVMAFANSRELVVAPAGGLTKQDIGGIPERVDILLRTTRLRGIQHYDPGDLTISIHAGTPFAEALAQLGEHHQWLPYDAPKLKTATVGGCLATGSAGPLKHAFGGLRDFCIGVQFVIAEGKIAKGGGMVVKNVAGYDLMKLLAGSYGTVGVIARANFKVFPRPRQTRTFACSFVSLDEALEFRTKVLHSPLTPICLEIVSPIAPEYMSEPAPVRDLDHYAPSQPPARSAATWQIVLRAAGSDNVLARYAKELGSTVEHTLDGAAEEQFWERVSNFEYSVLRRHRNAMVMYTHLTIQAVGPALKALEKAASDHNFIPAMLGRAATGNLVAAFVPVSADPPSAMQYANCASDFRGMLLPGSSAEVAHCPTEAKPHFDVWGSTPSDITMMRAIKKAIDPKNILNRGRFIV